MTKPLIPITNVSRQQADLMDILSPVFAEVMLSGQYIRGEYLARFEMEFSRYLGVRYCVGVNSGTDALAIALKAAGVGPGCEVITTAMSYLATAEAICMAGARPVFVDIAPDGTDCIDHTLIQKAITDKTRAIIPVHLHGYPCNMEEINKIAKLNKLIVIEDCAQAAGLMIGDRRAGSLGKAGCFSFFPTKNLGAVGDGGAIVTDDPELYRQALIHRDHGCAKRNEPLFVGMNSRLDGLQAAILSVKLASLDEWNAARQTVADRYSDLFSKHLPRYPRIVGDVQLPASADRLSALGLDCVYHHYALRVSARARDVLAAQLLSVAGVEAHSYYPRILPEMDAYGAPQWFPRDIAESHAYTQSRQGLALPMCPYITEPEIETVVIWFCELLDKILYPNPKEA